MAAEGDLDHGVEQLLSGLRQLQGDYGAGEVIDAEHESPAAALDSLEEAVGRAPTDYRPYLEEAVRCYRNSLYRAAILMVWSATIQHLYSTVGEHRGGIAKVEKANKARFGTMKKYREVKKQDDLSYLGEKDLIWVAEDAGVFNRDARKLLHERLDLRNLCGHPTRYTPGREETVIFVESLVLNVLSGTWLNW
jgi:hypothetical protein